MTSPLSISQRGCVHESFFCHGAEKASPPTVTKSFLFCSLYIPSLDALSIFPIRSCFSCACVCTCGRRAQVWMDVQVQTLTRVAVSRGDVTVVESVVEYQKRTRLGGDLDRLPDRRYKSQRSVNLGLITGQVCGTHLDGRWGIAVVLTRNLRFTERDPNPSICYKTRGTLPNDQVIAESAGTESQSQLRCQRGRGR